MSEIEHYGSYVDDPSLPPKPTLKRKWEPLLNKTQKKIFNSLAKYVLAYGEKGSGKTVGGLHALVRHCYEEEGALALILAPQIRTGKEGVISDLEWVLDIWRNGNIGKDGNRVDEGMGLQYTESALDPQTKDRVIFIGNRHGGWSKVILISIPYAEVVAKRMKALSPSFVFADEFTELDGPEYFTYVAQQIGRRRGISGPQQYYAATNPEGPSHWAYKVFFDDPVDHETGERDPDYEVYHVPIAENSDNLPPGYLDGLKKLYRESTDKKRLLHGEWVDRPSGDSIFKNYFDVEGHVRGDAKVGEGILPVKGLPLIVSYDPGPVNFSVHFLQMIPTKDKGNIWIIFDELNLVGKYKPDYVVVKQVLAMMDDWSTEMGGASFIHIGDEAAWTHMRHDGSFDAKRIQDLSGGRIRIRGCPKGKESVPARVQMTISMLLSDSLYVSATCPKTIEMFRLLSSEPPKAGKYDANVGFRPKRSPYLHSFDSFSYAPFYFQCNPAAFMIRTGATRGGSVFRVGNGG